MVVEVEELSVEVEEAFGQPGYFYYYYYFFLSFAPLRPRFIL